MARVVRGQEEAFGNDSFLDVVANIVGILIILVVVASMRIKHMPSILSPNLQSREKALEALNEAQSQVAMIDRETRELDREMQLVMLTTQARDRERGVLAQFVAAHERDLAERRNSLTGAAREELDLQQAKAAAESKLGQIARERHEIDNTRPTTVEIKAYPTPLSKTVYGLEAHFQLKDGLIVAVPFEELLRKVKHKVESQLDRLLDAPEFNDTVGPIDGFRLRYFIERVDVQADVGRRGGSYPRFHHCELIPMAHDLGEPVEQALRDNSEFHNALAGLDPRSTTVTLWTYSDSFPLFREVRKHLHDRGYSVAGRPLNDGQLISASDEGTKSSAQ